MNAPATPASGSTTSRKALTGDELNLIIKAAHRALLDKANEADVSPCKIAKTCRRFAKMLCRSRMTFHEFLADKANQVWAQGDPVMVRTISYLDPTGDRAARNVDRERRRNA